MALEIHLQALGLPEVQEEEVSTRLPEGLERRDKVTMEEPAHFAVPVPVLLVAVAALEKLVVLQHAAHLKVVKVEMACLLRYLELPLFMAVVVEAVHKAALRREIV